jgi:predicted  nucleic acid-binding Zn-ribbon protein
MTAAAELADDELAEALAAIQAEREYLTRLSDEWNALQRHAEQMRDDYTAHTDDTNEARARAVAATYREVAALMEDATWRAMRRPSPRPTPRN